MANIDKDYEDYKDFDMSGATRGIHPIIKAKQAENQAQKQGFDEDILDWISKQDKDTRDYINGMVRNFILFKNSAKTSIGM